VSVVRDPSVWIDSELSMRQHVSRVARTGLPPASSSFTLSVHDNSAAMSLHDSCRPIAIVFSRLDYCNAVLAGLPSATLQRVLTGQSPDFTDLLTPVANVPARSSLMRASRN